MLKSRKFVKRTRKGQVVNVVREHYLRDDLPHPLPGGEPAPPPGRPQLAASAEVFAVLDTNVVLHQLDVLEAPEVAGAVVLGTVLAEARQRSPGAHERLRRLTEHPRPGQAFPVFSNEHHRATYVGAPRAGESPNDRNDRAVRRAAAWLAQQARELGLPGRVVLVTDDAACRAKAQAEAEAEAGGGGGGQTLAAWSTAEWVRRLYPALADAVAGPGGPLDGAVPDAEAEGAGGKRPKLSGAGKGKGKGGEWGGFAEHLPLSALQKGLQAGRLHQGALRVNRFDCWEAWVAPDGLEHEVLVRGRDHLNRATDGDVVAVRLLPREPPAGAGAEGGGEGEGEGDGPRGEVVGIIRRVWRQRGYAAAVAAADEARARAAPAGRPVALLCAPADRRLPLVRLRTRQAAELVGKRLVVQLDAWPAAGRHPEGHLVRVLGALGDREAETAAVLLEHDVEAAPFSAAVHACVPPLPWAFHAPRDLPAGSARVDLRHLDVCSVDPPGCRDIDDALHARRLDGEPGRGRVEVGVHIADVAHFLAPDTAMDAEAARRGTSVYLVGQRIDMLPKPLTEDICSLRAGVDRLCFSAVWELEERPAAQEGGEPMYEVAGVRFHRSVIHSRAALTYAEAQARLDASDAEAAGPGDAVTASLRLLRAVARDRRAKRMAAGALTLASPEVRFEIDTETHDPLDVGMYETRETNRLVEELMLMANIAVAERVLAEYPGGAVLRKHPAPSERMLEPLVRACAASGLAIRAGTSRELGASLDACERPGDPYFNTAVRILGTRCMSQAVYFSSAECGREDYRHYGLAAPLYTHFTSPIRRYADVLVHRLLAAALGLAPLPAALLDARQLPALCRDLNYRHKHAQHAGRASIELHTVLFFRTRPQRAEARVLKVQRSRLVVLVPKFGVEAPVALPGAGDDVDAEGGRDGDPDPGGAGAAAGGGWRLEGDGFRVRSAQTGQAFAVFDSLTVAISVEASAGGRQRLVLALCQDEAEAAPGGEPVE